MEQSPNTIIQITEEFLTRLGFETNVQATTEDNVIKLRVETPEASLLIGRGGETLLSVRHVLKLLIGKQTKEPFVLDFDINNYREQKIMVLQEIARTLAERVISSQDSLVLKPMSAADRRIIHVELALYKGVVTESVGSEPERKLAIRPTRLVSERSERAGTVGKEDTTLDRMDPIDRMVSSV